MIEWPKDRNEIASFEDLTAPIVRALAIAIGRRMVHIVGDGPNGSKFDCGNCSAAMTDIDYDGYNIGEDALACCHDPETRLKADNLRYEFEGQGRNPVDVIVSLAIQVGIEQGRRIERRDAERGGDAFTLKMIRILLDERK